MKLAILYSKDHTLHVMLNRVVNSMVAAGASPRVVDCARGRRVTTEKPYTHARIQPFEARLPIKALWPIVRRLGLSALNDRFWGGMLHLRMFVDALRLGWRATLGRPDRYVVCDLVSAGAGLFARRIAPAPLVYIAYEIESEQGYGEEVRIQRSVMHAWESFILPRVDQLVAPNRFRAAHYAEHHALRRSPVVVRNLAPLVNIRRTRQLHTLLELPEHCRIVLYHGALMAHRALDRLVRSAAEFDSEIVLVLIGTQNDYYESTLFPLLQDPALAQRVRFVPYIPPEHLPPYVGSADLGVVIYENVNLNNYLCAPTKLYEYIMWGVPVIVRDYPEPREVLAQYPVGVIMDTTQPHAIADAVNRFFAEPTAPDARQATFEAARQTLNWESESEIIAKVLGIEAVA